MNLKSAADYNVLVIWISIAKFILKVIEFVKSRLNKRKLEPEFKKDIMILNLDT